MSTNLHTQAKEPVVEQPAVKQAGRPRTADLEARMNQLLHTAGCLFLEKGYSKVSLEMIAREAHVAVRTIYVKFGGKAGLLHAVLMHNRARFFPDMEAMERDTRPVREVVTDFATRFLNLLNQPEARSIQRMVIAEAKTTPELAQAFYDAGPSLTRQMLRNYFARPDVRTQLREDTPMDLLPAHLINCVIGDCILHFMFDTQPATCANKDSELAQRLELFFRSVLK